MIPTKSIIYYFITFLFFGSIISCSSEEDVAINDDTVVVDDDPIPTDDDPTPVDSLYLSKVYVNTYGGSDEDDSFGVATTPDGGYIVASSTQSTDGDVSDKTGDDIDFWVTKFSSSGNIQWSKTYGGTENDDIKSIKAVNDGGYIVIGATRSSDGDVSSNGGFYDYWVVKLDASGNIQWEETFGYPGSDQGLDIFQTGDGGYFASGFLDVTASGGQGNEGRNPLHGVGEFWGIRMDANGDFIWKRYYGGTNNDRCYDALQASDGGFLMVGSSESDDYDITDSKGSYDYWVVRLTANGDKVWTKSFGGTGIDVGYSVIQTSDGNYVMVGDSRSDDMDVTDARGNADGWVVKFNDSGNLLWQKSFGGSEYDTFRGVKELSNGNLVFTGSTRSSNSDISEIKGQSDSWLVITNANGEYLTSTAFGGSQIEFMNAIELSASEEIITVGNTESSDGDIATNKGGKDIIIAKFKIEE